MNCLVIRGLHCLCTPLHESVCHPHKAQGRLATVVFAKCMGSECMWWSLLVLLLGTVHHLLSGCQSHAYIGCREFSPQSHTAHCMLPMLPHSNHTSRTVVHCTLARLQAATVYIGLSALQFPRLGTYRQESVFSHHYRSPSSTTTIHWDSRNSFRRCSCLSSLASNHRTDCRLQLDSQMSACM